MRLRSEDNLAERSKRTEGVNRLTFGKRIIYVVCQNQLIPTNNGKAKSTSTQIRLCTVKRCNSEQEAIEFYETIKS